MIAPRELAAFEERLKRRLADVNDTLRQSADAQDAVKLDQTSVGRLSRMDAMQQQATRLGLREELQREKRRVEAALARIRGGLYGICCACEQEMSVERLQANPAAPFCMDCEIEIWEKDRRR